MTEKMFDPAIDCNREDCKIHKDSGMTTLMYYPPVYDKYGNNINPDMNSTTYHARCSSCNKDWIEVYRGGERVA